MYKLEHSQTKNDGWVLTDTENLIVIEFIEHKFRESHKVTFIDEAAIIEKYNPEQIASLLTKMGLFFFYFLTSINCIYL